jgi:hypothetical protein
MPARPNKKATEPAQPEAPEAEAPEPEAPLNRAERRAKARGKSTDQAQPSGRGKIGGSKGPAQSPRMWANRRSGG